MSDIFREVDEAMQQEKAARFWKEYGPTIILAAVILVVSTAATTAYRTWDGWRDQQETEKLMQASQKSEDLVAAYLDVAKETRSGHEAVALLTAGNIAAKNKDFKKASELYNQAASDSSSPSDLQDLAAILYSRAVQMTGDDVDYKALADKITPIAKNKKSAFQLQAKLEAAVLYGDGLKDYAKAIDLLADFKDQEASSLKEKADALKHVYEFEQTKSPKA